MTNTLHQNGREDSFFATPPVSFEEIRGWIKDAGGADGIGIGAVVEVDKNDKVVRIAGEMVMPGGKDAYMVGKDGIPHLITPEDEKKYKVTFAQVGYMPEAPGKTIELDVTSPADLKEKLQKKIDEQFPGQKNDAYMVRINGTFADMNLRGIDTETRDVRLLKEIRQLVQGDNARENIHGEAREYRLIGVYSKPGAVEKGVTFDDVLHLHGLDNVSDAKQHKHGGHVMGFGPAHVSVEVMPVGHWLLATREQAESVRSAAPISWVDKLRVPKHMASKLLDMTVGDVCFKTHLENAIKAQNAEIKKLTRQNQDNAQQPNTENIRKVDTLTKSRQDITELLIMLTEIARVNHTEDLPTLDKGAHIIGGLRNEENDRIDKLKESREHLGTGADVVRPVNTVNEIIGAYEQIRSQLEAVQGAYIDLKHALGVTHARHKIAK